MIVADGKLVIGLPRCGCLYTRDVLRKAFPGSDFFGKEPHHTPLANIPVSLYRGMKVIGLRRNPFAWYLSRWACNPNLQVGFSEYLNAEIRNPHGKIGKEVENWPKSREEIGAYTYMHIAYHYRNAADVLANYTLANYPDGQLDVDVWLQTETLTTDLVRLFGNRVRPYFGESTNASAHASYRAMFNDADRKLVERLDSWMFQTHGWKF